MTSSQDTGVVLKPCPFCGGEAQALAKLNVVACSSPFCGGQMRWTSLEPIENTIAAWNARALRPSDSDRG